MKQIKNKTTVVFCVLFIVAVLAGCGQRLNMDPPADRVQDVNGY